MSYNSKGGHGYGNQSRKGSRSFHSAKKQKLADDIAAKKKKLHEKISNDEIGNGAFGHGYVAGEIDALTWVEGKIPLDSSKSSESPSKDPIKVRCPRDDTVFEPVVSDSVYGGLPGSGKSIWCPKCGATFNNKPGTNEWANGPQSLTILE